MKDYKAFKEWAKTLKRTITLDEFSIAQAEVIVEFQKSAREDSDLEEYLPILMIAPALFARLAHKIFDKSDENIEMAETKDEDRKQ